MIIKKFSFIYLGLFVNFWAFGHGYYNYAFSNHTHVKHNLRFDPVCLNRDNRVPKFVSLTQKDENVRIAIDFDVPFLSIPVNKSINGLMNTMQSAAHGMGFEGLQFNYPALLMVPLFGIGGMLLRGINHQLNSSSSNILQQIVDIPNTNINYLLQSIMKKKFPQKRNNDDQFIKYKEKKRGPRFVSLQHTGDGVQLAIDFIVPFLTIPVKKSIYNAMNTMQGMTSTFGALQFNYVAVGAGAVVALGGLFLQILNNAKHNDETIDFFNKLLGKKDPRKLDQIPLVSNLLEKAMKKYDFDARACSLKMICWYVKKSKDNVRKGKANRLEKFVEGFSRTDWTMELVINTLVDDGIRAADDQRDCAEVYAECKINQKSIEKVLDYIL